LRQEIRGTRSQRRAIRELFGERDQLVPVAALRADDVAQERERLIVGRIEPERLLDELGT
jgi:hypothetical protein